MNQEIYNWILITLSMGILMHIRLLVSEVKQLSKLVEGIIEICFEYFKKENLNR